MVSVFREILLRLDPRPCRHARKYNDPFRVTDLLCMYTIDYRNLFKLTIYLKVDFFTFTGYIYVYPTLNNGKNVVRIRDFAADATFSYLLHCIFLL